MKSTHRILSSLVVLSFLAVFCALGARAVKQERTIQELRTKQTQQREGRMLGLTVATETYPSVTGESVRIGASAQGSRLLFFAPACPYCRVDAAHWADEQRDLAAHGQTLIAVSTKAEGLAEFVAEFGLAGIPVIFDAGDRLRKELAVDSTPYRIQLDRFGRVMLRDEALFTSDHKRPAFSEALSGWAPEAREALLMTCVRTVAPAVTRITEMPLRQDGAATLVCEGEEGLVGFARLVSQRIEGPTVSDLECLVVVDADGALLGLLPLAMHRDQGLAVERSTLEAWYTSDTIVAKAPALQSAVRAVRRGFDADLGRTAQVAALHTGR